MRRKYFSDSFRDKIGFKHKAQLKKDLEKLNVTQIAKKYGVDQNAIRYWIKKFKLEIIHKKYQKRINIKIKKIGLNSTKEERLFQEDKIYNKKIHKRRKFNDV